MNENPKTNPLLSFTIDASELQAASPTHSLEDLCAIPTEDSLVAAIESLCAIRELWSIY
jgi:hypothetical protein